ncbi:ankyrin repeat domain-containing protein 50 [Achlya hypogyna]|uniref:Ankyrin repeat domain-containing protein 50 n=1 Tax=Achlya hypogyna TaxID=1202772 RepID=A0A1V9ZRB6_ACHHY|nr:ankyrin repeat domain-containing protein 50 [Achlya hypogyna]
MRGSTSSHRMALLLDLAADNKWTEVDEFLKKGHVGNLHARNDEGLTLLLQACDKGCASTVQGLMAFPVFDSLLTDALPDGSNGFLLAAAKGHLDVINVLLERSINVNFENHVGWTALSLASFFGHAPVVARLARHPEVHVDVANEFGADGFLVACMEGHTDVVAALVDHPAVDVNRTHLNVRQEVPALNARAVGSRPRSSDTDGCTGLVYAASQGADSIVALLLAHPEIDVNRPNATGRTAFMRACKNGHLGVVRQLLARPDLDLNHVDRNGWNAVLWAVSESRVEVLDALAAQETLHVNQIANNGVSALLRACQYADVPAVTTLLRHPHIDINATNKNGMTSLMYACSQGEMGIVAQLLKHPLIDVNHLNQVCCCHARAFKLSQASGTACMFACKNGHLAMVELLIAHPDFEFNLQDEVWTGWHCLLFAANNGHAPIVDLLLAHDVDVNLPNANGETAFMHACQNGHVQVVQSLLAVPSLDVNRKDNDGWTGLMAACSFGCTAIVEELLARAAAIDLNHVNHSGFTGLMLACQNGHFDVVVLLLAQEGIDVNATSTVVGVSALMLCCEKGNLDLVRAFLDVASRVLLDVNGKNHEGMTAADFLARNLHCADSASAFNEDITAIIARLVRMGSSLNERKRSTVCKGECKGHAENLSKLAWLKKWPLVEQYLIDDAFGDINKTYLGFSVLHRAAMDGQERLVARILQYKSVDIDQLDKDGKTALDLAIDHRRVGCVQQLLAAGAAIYHSVKSKAREFHRTTESSDERELAAQALIQDLLTAEQRQREQYPLHSFLRFGRVQDCIDGLPRFKHALEEVDADGKTILILAAERGLVELVVALLHEGAEIDNPQLDPTTAINGKTPLVFATLAGHADVVQVLLSNLADMDVIFMDYGGKFTVLSWLEAELENAFNAPLLECKDLIEKEIFYRANSSVYVDKLKSTLYARRTNEPFDEALFNRVVRADPALGRILLDDCIEPDRHTLGFTKLHEVYGGELIQHSPLYTLVNYSSDNAERVHEAKKLLEHVVMQRVLALKWEFFAQRLFIEELLMHLVLVVSMTLSVTLEAAPTTHSAEMTLWVVMMVFVVNGLIGVQALRPNTLWSLAKGLEHGWPSPIVPPFATLKTMVKWIIAVVVMLSTLGTTALLLWLVFPRLPGHLSNFLVYASLGLSTLYFTLLEFKEYRGETGADVGDKKKQKEASRGFHIGWKYFESFVNIWQLGTYLAILGLYIPGELHLLPFVRDDLQLALGSGLTLSLWILSLEYFAVYQTAGYLLPMMSGLLVDVTNFFMFYSVFQIGATCAFYQLLRATDVGYDNLWMSFTRTYFVMLGQYDVRGELDKANEPFISTFTLVLLIVHATVSVIMLMNVLLAIMNKTVDRGIERSKTEAVWSFADSILRMELTLGASERMDLMYLNRPGYTDAADEPERQPLLRKLTSAKQPKPHAGILNPAFGDKLLKAECVLDDDDVRVIKELEETVHEWKTQLVSLEGIIESEIARLLQNIAHANHFAPTPILAAEAELIGATKANVALRFRLVLEQRPPELKDMPSRLKDVQRAVETECQAFVAAMAAVAPADDFFYHMVHGLPLGRAIERGVEAIKLQFAKAVTAFQHKADEELTLGDLQAQAAEIQATQLAAFKEHTQHWNLVEMQLLKPPTLGTSISLGGRAPADDGHEVQAALARLDLQWKRQLTDVKAEAAKQNAALTAQVQALQASMDRLLERLTTQSA